MMNLNDMMEEKITQSKIEEAQKKETVAAATQNEGIISRLTSALISQRLGYDVQCVAVHSHFNYFKVSIQEATVKLENPIEFFDDNISILHGNLVWFVQADRSTNRTFRKFSDLIDAMVYAS